MVFTKDDFGSHFDWGVSTAAYQIEGAHNIEGKSPSIWDEFVKVKSRIHDESHANVSCDHYHLYGEDIEMINDLNIPNYRFSLAWSRVLPHGIGQPNTKGLDFYDRLIDCCLEQKINPWVTLYHWDLPQCLEEKGGWTNRDVLSWFSELAELCTRKFGDRVKNWMVLNEPMVFTGAGYFLGYHAPGRKGLGNFIPAMHHATLAQGVGGRIVRDEVAGANIGTTYSCSHIDPKSNQRKDIEAAVRFDALLNRLYLEPVLGLGYPTKDLPLASRVEQYFRSEDEALMPFDFDFIGIQNYTREIVKHSWYVPYLQGQIVEAIGRKVPKTTMGWEVFPKAIYKLLKKYDQYDGVKKIIVTENGAAFQDEVLENKVMDIERTRYLQSHIHEVLRAKKDGVNVGGYFVWTLMDNFEWAEGYTQRFGIVHTDFDTKKRVIKDSGYWYSRFLQSSKVHHVMEVG